MAGYTRTPGQAINLELASGVKLEKDGMIIALDAAGKGKLCTNTDTPYGIALNSTMDVQKYNLIGEKVYKSGGQIAIVRSGQVKVPYATNSGVSKGAELIATTDSAAVGNGHCESSAKATITTAAHLVAELKRRKRLIGIADESISSGTIGRPILVSLKIQQGLGP